MKTKEEIINSIPFLKESVIEMGVYDELMEALEMQRNESKIHFIQLLWDARENWDYDVDAFEKWIEKVI